MDTLQALSESVDVAVTSVDTTLLSTDPERTHCCARA
jgi:hypothetical protein